MYCTYPETAPASFGSCYLDTQNKGSFLPGPFQNLHTKKSLDTSNSQACEFWASTTHRQYKNTSHSIHGSRFSVLLSNQSMNGLRKPNTTTTVQNCLPLFGKNKKPTTSLVAKFCAPHTQPLRCKTLIKAQKSMHNFWHERSTTKTLTIAETGRTPEKATPEWAIGTKWGGGRSAVFRCHLPHNFWYNLFFHP